MLSICYWFQAGQEKREVTHLNRCVKHTKARSSPDKNQREKTKAIVLRGMQWTRFAFPLAPNFLKNCMEGGSLSFECSSASELFPIHCCDKDSDYVNMS